MRSSWPAWLSALAAGLVFAVGGRAAPPISTTLAAAPSIVRADRDLVVAAVPGNRKGRCAELVLWRVGQKPVPIKTIAQCDNDGVGLDAVVDLAVAGQTVAWQETNGGNNLEISISTATLAHPVEHGVSYVENGGGAAGDPAGDWTGALVGHGGLLAYASWKACDPAGGGYARACGKGLPDLYDQALHRIGGGTMLRGPDAFAPVWTDGTTIVIRRAGGVLLLVDAHGQVVRRFAAVPGLTAAAVQGSQLVTLTRTKLTAWNARTGAAVRSFRLAPATRVLEDLDGGVAVLGSHGTTHLIRLSDGSGATFAPAAHAQLEPQGLYFATGRTLRFVPRARIRFG